MADEVRQEGKADPSFVEVVNSRILARYDGMGFGMWTDTDVETRVPVYAQQDDITQGMTIAQAEQMLAKRYCLPVGSVPEKIKIRIQESCQCHWHSHD
jgi:hypothetical protein